MTHHVPFMIYTVNILQISPHKMCAMLADMKFNYSAKEGNVAQTKMPNLLYFQLCQIETITSEYKTDDLQRSDDSY